MIFSVKKPRKKKCKSCGEVFQPERNFQPACSIACALEIGMESAKKKAELKAREGIKARNDELKKKRAQHRADKERVKSRAQWLSEAQSVFNKYIRLRDKKDGCISCNKPSSWSGQWHASHYRSVKAASAVRFNEYNVHKSCSICNNHLSGNIRDYTPRIIEKIGIEKFEFLLSQNKTVRYEVDYLKRLKAVYQKKIARLERKYEQMHY